MKALHPSFILDVHTKMSFVERVKCTASRNLARAFTAAENKDGVLHHYGQVSMILAH